MSTIEDVQQILATRQLSSFIDRKEDVWFDAKAAHYDLASAAGRWELAKDVSAFSNAEGGFVVIGLHTEPVLEEHTDRVTGLTLLAEATFNVVRVRGVLQEYLYPAVHGLEISWVEDVAGGGQGVGVIYVPEQERERRLTLMKQVIDEGTELRRFVFGFAKGLLNNNIDS